MCILLEKSVLTRRTLRSLCLFQRTKGRLFSNSINHEILFFASEVASKSMRDSRDSLWSPHHCVIEPPNIRWGPLAAVGRPQITLV